jgi:glycosyltransferase involved in cell wall biosynthesis
MSTSDLPLVSVLTPVYNGEAYLEECIESVLAQTYSKWEYIIVNNCSKDRTGEIAERYAARDNRIRVHHNTDFLGVIANHNHAFALIAPSSKYCKVVSADDAIFPDCLTEMVACAEANPSAGVIGSYQLSGGGDDWAVRCTGLPYWRTFLTGREISRLHLLNGLAIFGAPTSNLFRSDLVRTSTAFFPNPRAEADISGCLQALQRSDFGFVHQVLSYERCHGSRVTTGSRSFDKYQTSRIHDLLDYGPGCMSEAEQDKRMQELLDDYYRCLGIAVVNFRRRDYWQFQRSQFAELHHRLEPVRLLKWVCVKVFDLLLNPGMTLAKIRRRRTQAAAQPRLSLKTSGA